MRNVIKAFGLCLMFAFAACAHLERGEDDAPPDGGTDPGPDGGCEGDDCPCPDCPPPMCDGDEDCGCGQTCTDGACEQTSCCSDADCPDGQTCDDGTCKDPPPECRLVRFTTPLEGVDGDTSGWSTDDTLVSLGASSWPILGDGSYVKGWSDGHPETLTHRGTRGLGVSGGEQDEVDAVCTSEKIKIHLAEPMCVSYVEVRSLFDDDVGWGGTEKGMFELRLGGASRGDWLMAGVEPYGSTDGVWSIDLPGVRADRIDFWVPAYQPYSAKSEFAVAAVVVCPCEDDDPPDECGNDGDCPDGKDCRGGACVPECDP